MANRFRNGDPGGSRTPNPQLRRLMLYPVELRGRPPEVSHSEPAESILHREQRCVPTRPTVLPNEHSRIARKTSSGLKQKFPWIRVQPLARRNFQRAGTSISPELPGHGYSTFSGLLPSSSTWGWRRSISAAQFSNLRHVRPFLESDAVPVLGDKSWQHFGDNLVVPPPFNLAGLGFP
jgi:hypothetical protein